MEIYIGWLEMAAPYVGALASVAGAVLALINFLRKLRKGGEGFFRRRLRLLTGLRNDVEVGSDLENYLDSSIELEKFRIASGTRLNPREMAVLMNISELGLWGPEHIRALGKYLKFPATSQTPKIVISGGDVLDAWISFFYSFAMFLSGIFLWAALVWRYGVIGCIGGALAFIVATLIGGLVAGGYREMKNAKEIKDYLDKNPEILL